MSFSISYFSSEFTIHFATINTGPFYLPKLSRYNLQYTLLLLIPATSFLRERLGDDLQYTLLLLILYCKIA